MNIKSDSISKTKTLGSAKEGSSHWIALRVTSIALIPLTIWFSVIVLYILKNNLELEIIKPIFNLLCFILFTVFSLYHGALGMQVIIEDYIHCKILKRICLMMVVFTSIITVLAVLCALIKLHVSISHIL